MSSAEGPRFAEVAREMTERIRELGPSPVKTGKARQSDKGDVREKEEETVLKAV